MKTVSRLSIAPVKGMGLVHPDELELTPAGVADNRRFYLVDANGRRYGQIRDGALVQIRPTWDGRRLRLDFPDGTQAEGEVELDGEIVTDFYGRPVNGHLVVGPWNDAISRYVGREIRLVRADEPGGGVDRGRGTVTMLGDASLDALSDGLDARRFRMLIGIAGTAPYEEDDWLGRLVRVGDAVLRLHEQVARCAITTQNPDSGTVDFDTLRTIKEKRGFRDGSTKDLDLGVFGEVDTPGRIRVGDPVEPV